MSSQQPRWPSVSEHHGWLLTRALVHLGSRSQWWTWNAVRGLKRGARLQYTPRALLPQRSIVHRSSHWCLSHGRQQRRPADHSEQAKLERRRRCCFRCPGNAGKLPAFLDSAGESSIVSQSSYSGYGRPLASTTILLEHRVVLRR